MAHKTTKKAGPAQAQKKHTFGKVFYPHPDRDGKDFDQEHRPWVRVVGEVLALHAELATHFTQTSRTSAVSLVAVFVEEVGGDWSRVNPYLGNLASAGLPDVFEVSPQQALEPRYEFVRRLPLDYFQTLQEVCKPHFPGQGREEEVEGKSEGRSGG